MDEHGKMLLDAIQAAKPDGVTFDAHELEDGGTGVELCCDDRDLLFVWAPMGTMLYFTIRQPGVRASGIVGAGGIEGLMGWLIGGLFPEDRVVVA